MTKKRIPIIIMIFLIFLCISVSNSCSFAADTVDSVMDGANDFLASGQSGLGQINQTELEKTSDFIYNLLLAIALVVAVVIGMVIGIQFMTASVEEKAKIKESLVPYVVGCVVVFGAFGIWKLAVTVLSGW